MNSIRDSGPSCAQAGWLTYGENPSQIESKLIVIECTPDSSQDISRAKPCRHGYRPCYPMAKPRKCVPPLSKKTSEAERKSREMTWKGLFE